MRTSTARTLLPAVTAAALVLAGPAQAGEGNLFIKPYVGLSFLQDNDFGQSGVAGAGASGSGSYDTGWLAGAGFGYRYGGGWMAELAWEYRSNGNDQVSFSDGTRFTEGDLASNIIYLNGYRVFGAGERSLRPYVGAGLGWVQEIDLDLEAGGTETSLSGDGDIAWQIMAGLETNLAERWRLQGELRYNLVSGIDLEQEGGNARVSDLDYEAWLLTVGAAYDF